MLSRLVFELEGLVLVMVVVLLLGAEPEPGKDMEGEGMLPGGVGGAELDGSGLLV